MATPIYGLKDDYGAGTPPSASHLNRLSDLDESQLQSAIEAIGAGVLNGLEVNVDTGLFITISAGFAVIHSPTYGFEIVKTLLDSSLGPLADDTSPIDNYIFITFPSGDPYDTPGLPAFLSQTSDVLATGVPLAKVTVQNGAIIGIQDLRVLPNNQALPFDLVGVGRLVGADSTILEPIPTTSANSITIPSGNVYIIGEKRIKLTNDDIIEITQYTDGAKYGFLSIDSISGLPTILDDNWYSTFPSGSALAALQEQGFPCIGLVTLVASVVTAIDKTLEDVVYTQAGILHIISSLPGVSGGTGVSQADFDSLHDFVYNTLYPLVLSLQSQVGTGTTFSTASTDLDFERFCVLLSSQVRDRRQDFTKYPGSINIPGLQGNYEIFIDGTHAQNNTVTGNWIRNDSDRDWS